MRRSVWTLWVCVVVSAFLAVETRGDEPQTDPGSEPQPQAGDDTETPIYVLRDGEDLAELFQRLGAPDFILKRGGETEADSAPVPEPAAAESTEVEDEIAAGITSVQIDGAVRDRGDLAEVSIELGLWARGPGPHRVPIGLDGLYLREVESVPDGLPIEWEAEPPGRWRLVLPEPVQKEMTVRVSLVVPVQSLDDRRGLSMEIPPAVQTKLRLDLPDPVVEATLSNGMSLPVEPIDGGRAGRIEAMLPALSTLSLSWLPRREEDRPQPPLLTGTGEIALEVDAGTATARSTWRIQSRRGEADALTVRLDPADELLEVTAGGRQVEPTVVSDGDGETPAEIRLPLPALLRKGESIDLTLTTLRRLEPEETARLVFRGHPFDELTEQNGTLTLSRPEGLRVVAEPERGLLRIDTRELSEQTIARARLPIALAFRFATQPFEMAAEVAPMPALLRVEDARSSIALKPSVAEVETWLDYRVVRGRVVQVEVDVPSGLEVTRVGPENVVASWTIEPADGPATEVTNPENSNPKSTVLNLALAGPIREAGSSFRIELAGLANLGSGENLDVPLFRPVKAAFDLGRIVVTAEPDLSVSVGDAGSKNPMGSPVIEGSPSNGDAGGGPWSRPADASVVPALSLEHRVPVSHVPLRVEARERSVHRESDLLARLGRDSVDVQQDVVLYVRNGSLPHVDIVVPKALARRWEWIDRSEVDRVEPLGPDPSGAEVHRLTLIRDVDHAPIRLRFAFRLPRFDALEPGRTVKLEIPRIGVRVEGTASPPRIEVAADPGIDLRPIGDGWESPPEGQWVAGPQGGPALPIRLVWVRPTNAEDSAIPHLSVMASASVELPEVLVSRLWVRTEQGTDGSVRASAWYRIEAHNAIFDFALPDEAELERAYVSGQPMPSSELEALDRPGTFRLRLPAEATAPGMVVGLSYRVPAGAGETRWVPPTLLGSASVLQTLWEVRVPWSRALVGVPDRYTDENQWYWAGYVWKRRPWKSADQLVTWVAGSATSADRLGPPVDNSRIGDHGYLFGRPDDPIPLEPTIASRALLVGVCSGSVLLVGVLALVWNPWPRWVIPAGAVLVGVTIMLIDRSTTLLVVQASAVGFALVAVARLTRRSVDRRRPGSRSSSRFPIGSTRSEPFLGSGSATPPALVGSEASTAIRAQAPAPNAPTGAPAPSSQHREEPSTHEPGPSLSAREDEIIDIPAPSRTGRNAF